MHQCDLAASLKFAMIVDPTTRVEATVKDKKWCFTVLTKSGQRARCRDVDILKACEILCAIGKAKPLAFRSPLNAAAPTPSIPMMHAAYLERRGFQVLRGGFSADRVVLTV